MRFFEPAVPAVAALVSLRRRAVAGNETRQPPKMKTRTHRSQASRGCARGRGARGRSGRPRLRRRQKRGASLVRRRPWWMRDGAVEKGGGGGGDLSASDTYSPLRGPRRGQARGAGRGPAAVSGRRARVPARVEVEAASRHRYQRLVAEFLPCHHGPCSLVRRAASTPRRPILPLSSSALRPRPAVCKPSLNRDAELLHKRLLGLHCAPPSSPGQSREQCRSR